MRIRVFLPFEFLGAFALVFFSGTVAAQEPVKFDTGLQKEFRGLEVQWTNAIKAGDRRRLEEFLAPGYVLTIAALGNPLIHVSRKDWLAAAGTTYKIQAYEFKDLVARRIGDGVVVVTSYYTQKAIADGRDRSGDFLLTDIWLRDGKRWRVAWRHSSEPETR